MEIEEGQTTLFIINSLQVVHLLDLAGDAKYLKTTIYGLSAYGPHAVCL